MTNNEMIEIVPEVIRVDREFAISPDELWDWVTQPQLTEKWFGLWRRIQEDGAEIEIIMNREEGSPTETAVILECNEKRGYTLAMGGSQTEEPWRVLIHVGEGENGGSRFTLIQPWDQEDMKIELQAGWEYYSDCLKAAITGTQYPEFSDYLSLN